MDKHAKRDLEPLIHESAGAFGAVVLTGPRRTGKTSLLRHAFPKANYVLLEDPETVGRFRSDPRGFLDDLEGDTILDEVQNVPELFQYVRARIDLEGKKRRWFLTGSQEAPLMRGVSESMAGRAAVFQLLPISVSESDRVSPLQGGFPEPLFAPKQAQLWYSSYLQTYLERDVRDVIRVRDLSTYRRFLALLATRHGQVLNRSEFAAPLGVTVATVSEWLSVLETTMLIALVPPYFANMGKRLIKSPKLYILDSGLVCHLLQIHSEKARRASPFNGAIFEGFVAAELLKQQVNRGQRREVYYFRDQQGLEVDFLVPRGDDEVELIEAKASRSVHPEMANSMLKLARAFATSTTDRRRVNMTVIHERSTSARAGSALVPGVKARVWQDYFARK